MQIEVTQETYDIFKTLQKEWRLDSITDVAKECATMVAKFSAEDEEIVKIAEERMRNPKWISEKEMKERLKNKGLIV
ncbi:hypothetical protein [Helicobacter apodemus]|uniref:CopG family transcriptional regulator n=1 Tax=Helicobacter apodemus TaxID=135569 RepID=A0A2U8FDG5_9HELI|nr:hypothetical protein [Helicobacter apodemus]AWI34176.1 hypothetical protein CDV25_04900 [Helicobacter apodemus]